MENNLFDYKQDKHGKYSNDSRRYHFYGKNLLKRGQNRKNINRQTRISNPEFLITDSYYEKQERDKQLKGGFYSSYFSKF